MTAVYEISFQGKPVSELLSALSTEN